MEQPLLRVVLLGTRTLRAITTVAAVTVGMAMVECTTARYDLKLWIGHLFEGAAYLPR